MSSSFSVLLSRKSIRSLMGGTPFDCFSLFPSSLSGVQTGLTLIWTTQQKVQPNLSHLEPELINFH